MKTLITSNILSKFKDTISEELYNESWKKLQDYQNEQDHVKTYSETTFQSEFLSKIFGDILGYIPRTKSLKDANLFVEHKNPNSGEKVDGAILDKNNEVKIVIELKSVKDTTASALLNKKRGGSDGKTPIQQAAVYLFQFPKSELAIVSNFDRIIIFDKKEHYRQEFSLFDMTYDEFKEFYLILSAESFWSGLTKLMISQTESEEKVIDDEFFIKVKTLHKMIYNSLKEDYAEDLFGKFLSLAILEDNGALPTNLINTIHGRKYDFDHQGKKTHWEVWSEFFKTMKSNTKSKEYLNISPKISSLDIWQRTDYFGRIKISKNILDLVVELSKYDLWSIPMDRLFYRISKELHHQYHTIIVDDMFDLIKTVMETNNFIAGEETTSFITLKTDSIDYPLVKLYNQLVNNKVILAEGEIFCLDESKKLPYNHIIDIIDLESIEVINRIKEHAQRLKTIEFDNCRYILVTCTNDLKDEIEIINYNETVSLKRNGIKNKIILLNQDEKDWLETYSKNSTVLSDYVTIVSEKDADIRLNLDSRTISTFDKEYNEWNVDDYLYETPNYIYMKLNDEKGLFIINSKQFVKMLMFVDYDKNSFIDLRVSEELTSVEFLEKSHKLKELSEKIALMEFKLDKLNKNNGDELEIIRLEKLLDNLYDQELQLTDDV